MSSNAQSEDLFQDVMQVCRNGHVITDLAHTYPERRPARLRPLRGGDPRPLPDVRHGTSRGGASCRACRRSASGGRRAAAPPAGPPSRGRKRPRPPSADPLAPLEDCSAACRWSIRQLRWRQGERPPFRVEDERDLEDLLRALLPLHFDDVRPESRTPRYAAGTRTDFLLAPERTAVTVKFVRPPTGVAQVAEQLKEDAAYYRGRPDCGVLCRPGLRPGREVAEPQGMEAAWSVREDDWELRCVVSTPVATSFPPRNRP